MNNMSWISYELYFVSFIICVASIIQTLRNAHIRRTDSIFYSYSLSIMMLLISIDLLEGNFATDSIVTWGRVLWFEIMLCIICSGWFFITFIAAFIDSTIDHVYLELSSLPIHSLIEFTLSVAGIMVSINALYKSYESADIHTMLFSVFDRKTEMSDFIIGCLGWGIILFSVVWHLFFIFVGFIVIIDAVRCRRAQIEISKNNGNEQLMETVSEHLRKTRLFNNAIEIILFEAMRRFPLGNRSAFYERLSENEFKYNYVEQYLKEEKFYTSSELFNIWNTNYRYDAGVKRSQLTFVTC